MYNRAVLLLSCLRCTRCSLEILIETVTSDAVLTMNQSVLNDLSLLLLRHYAANAVVKLGCPKKGNKT